MKYKKSAIDLTDLALGIVILGIVVSIGAVILTKVRDSSLDELDTFTVHNETVLVSNATDTTISGGKSLTTVQNASSGLELTAANYTFTPATTAGADATIDWTSVYNGSNVNISYVSYNSSDPRYSLANNATIGLAEYGNWFDIIVIVGVAGVILSLIFLAFGNANSNKDLGSSY
jgi:hypothetical protein|tara:strand:+ start:464 stop:988 length:525 start_codon:yes stop_codon:yes gene_type:complete